MPHTSATFFCDCFMPNNLAGVVVSCCALRLVKNEENRAKLRKIGSAGKEHDGKGLASMVCAACHLGRRLIHVGTLDEMCAKCDTAHA